jgi:hypothetical protein
MVEVEPPPSRRGRRGRSWLRFFSLGGLIGGDACTQFAGDGQQRVSDADLYLDLVWTGSASSCASTSQLSASSASPSARWLAVFNSVVWSSLIWSVPFLVVWVLAWKPQATPRTITRWLAGFAGFLGFFPGRSTPRYYIDRPFSLSRMGG